MPYGYNPSSYLPPPPDFLPLSPRAPQMGQPISFPEAAQRPAPQMGMLPPPPGDEDNFKSRLLRALPTLGAGLLGAIGGPKSALGNFGMGGAMANSKMLMADALQRSQQRAQEEQNTIKNVHAQMEEVAQIPDPRYQAVVQEYKQLLEGGLTGKEALKLNQSILGLGDIKGTLKRQQQLTEDEQWRRRAQMEAKLKQQTAAAARDTPLTLDDGQTIKVTGDQYLDYMIARDRQKAANAAAERQATLAGQREEARDRRFLAAQEGMNTRFGLRQDSQFQGKMDNFIGAESALASIESALQRFQNTSSFHPIDKGLAAGELNAKVESLSTLIGRNLGERGVFTDADREAFKQIINPGLLISQLAPKEATARLNELKMMLSRIKQRELEAYGIMNPKSGLLNYYGRDQYKDEASRGQPAMLSANEYPSAGEKPPGLRTENPLTQEQYNRLRPGQLYRDSDGRIRRKK